MGVSCWKKGLAGSLAALCLTGTAFAGSWQEKEVVPAEYKDIEYVANGELFWLEKPRERGITEYFHIREGLMTLPEGTMRGGDKDNSGIQVSGYAHDSYTENGSFSAIIVTGMANKARQGLILANGEEFFPMTPGKSFKVYDDGYVLIGERLYKDGVETGAAGILWRYYSLPDAWGAGGKNRYTLIDSKGELLADLPFLESIFESNSEIIIGRSNGKDKKKKAFRIWNMKLEEITPVGDEGFLSLVVLRKNVVKNGVSVREFEGIFARTKDGWSVYPYLGNASFGEPIKIDAREKEYFSSREVAPGYYRLGRPQGDGDFLLDINAKVVRRDANGVTSDGNRWTQQKWTSYAIPFPMIELGTDGLWYRTITNVRADAGHFIRLRDWEGEEITTLWESVYVGENYIVNRYNGMTRVVDMNGTQVKRFESPKEGYIPLVGKKEVPLQEEGQPRKFSVTEWKDWPGEGRYQPYYVREAWGILDLDTMADHVFSDPRFGRIVKVSDDGKRFWSYFETEKGKFKGIKEFSWVD
jgi:hypothetical protein